MELIGRHGGVRKSILMVVSGLRATRKLGRPGSSRCRRGVGRLRATLSFGSILNVWDCVRCLATCLAVVDLNLANRFAASMAWLRSEALKTPIEMSAPFIACRAQFGEACISSSMVLRIFAAAA